MAYIQDLVELIQARLPYDNLYNLELTNSAWSPPSGFWRTHFISSYGASLPNGADYELETVVLERLSKLEYNVCIIKQRYNTLLRLEDTSKEKLLIEASKCGNIDIVKLLLDKGANLHAGSDLALQEAAKNGHLDVVKLLLDNGANIHNKRDRALRLAARYGFIDVVKLLFDKGADIHAEDDESLRWAALGGHTDIVKLLLNRGADIHANDDNALELAAANGHLDVVKLLLGNGANVHTYNDYPLRLAANYGYLDVVKLLLDNGANITILNTVKPLPSSIQDYLSTLSQKQPETAQCIALTLKKTHCKKKAVKGGLCSIHLK